MSDMSALMSGMSGGMDMSSDPMFRIYNQQLAEDYWYIIAGFCGFMLFLRGGEYYQNWLRLRKSQTKSMKYPTKPSNIIEQAYATATAIAREMSYPQLVFKNKWLSWLSPPFMGRVILLLAYWAVLAFMMCNKAIVFDAYYYERIGFRGAWISVTQVPFVYLLASKSSIIGLIVGSSHERLNFFHRWASRTLLITVTVHGAFFFREWVRADFVSFELALMPMVKYGMGAWFVLLWTFLSSLGPLRSIAYEVFVIQHIAAAAVFLWLIWVHVPSYAAYNVWFAIGAISFDWVLRGGLMIYTNLRIRIKAACSGMQRIGHEAQLKALSGDITIITIKDIHFNWKAGQHIYLWLPRIGPLESHPFTIATPRQSGKDCVCNEIQLAIRAQKGFSRRIHRFAIKAQKGNKLVTLTAFVSHPYGLPPNWTTYETLLLISASTGASYTLPILESLLHTSRSSTVCTQRIAFLLVARTRSHISFYTSRLASCLTQAENLGIELSVEIAITDSDGDDADSVTGKNSMRGQYSDQKHEISSMGCDEKNFEARQQIIETRPVSLSSKNSSTQHSTKSEDVHGCCNASSSMLLPGKGLVYLEGRPDIKKWILRLVEITGGETSVAVCGGKSLVAKVRNSVAGISDERAVHKGTGANGIHLHVEEYSF